MCGVDDRACRDASLTLTMMLVCVVGDKDEQQGGKGVLGAMPVTQKTIKVWLDSEDKLW